MPEALRRLHTSPRGTGTTLNQFRLNALVTQLAFGGRRRRVYRQITALSGTRSGDQVLDVGCSSGYLARMLAAAAGPSGTVTGLDPSPSAIAYARRRGPGNVVFRTGVAQDLSVFPDASFDGVTSTLAVHHVAARQRQAAFREMYRVTRPGGRLLIADFDPARWVLPLHRGAARMQHAAASTGPLDELATQAGYQIQAQGTLPLLRYIVAVRPKSLPQPRFAARVRWRSADLDEAGVGFVARQDAGDLVDSAQPAVSGEQAGREMRQRLAAALDEYFASWPSGEAERFAASLARFTEEGPF